MKIPKALQKPAEVLGMPLQEFFLVMGLWLGSLVLGVVLRHFNIKVGTKYFICSISVVILAIVILKKTIGKKDPTPLLSFLASRFFRPHKIEMTKYDSIIRKPDEATQVQAD